MDKIDLSKFKHKIEVEIRFMDLDVLQHVNNARYLNFLEESRLAYCQEQLGLFEDIKELNVVVARIEIDFMRPIHYGNRLSIHTRISRLGKKSFTFESVFCVRKGGEINIVSKTLQTIVTIDPKSGKSVEISEEYRKKINLVEDLDE